MNKKNIWIHVGMVAIMFAAACIYLSPILGGKALVQGDQVKAKAMAHKLHQEKDVTGEFPSWESAMFSGMPAYQIREEPPATPFYELREVALMSHVGWANNIGILFLYLIGFYLAMVLLGLSPWLALIGALGFGLGSYNIIIIEAGHSTKAWAIAMMAPILAGVLSVLKTAVTEGLERRIRNRKMIWGCILFTVALILQIMFNHIQITYYTAIGCVIIGLTYLVYAIKKKQFKPFSINVGILALCALLAIGCNIRHLVVNNEYAKHTMRGGNELTVTPADLYGQDPSAKAENTNNGLNIEYAMKGWSYDIGETYTLLVPGAWGGASLEPIDFEKSNFVKAFSEKGFQYPQQWGEKAPLYRGDMLVTSGPVYFGAIIIFLFLLGMFVVKGADRWWILLASVVAILLSWGWHFLGLNEWLFNNLPKYNIFRTPSMALVLANVCMAIMAALTLKHVFDPKNSKEDREGIVKGLYISAGSLILIILTLIIASGSFNFTGPTDKDMGLTDEMVKGLQEDRHDLFISDSWRSLIFILLAAVTLWLYAKQKIKKAGLAIAIVGALIVIDLWGVDRRYLNENNYVEPEQLELVPDAIDERIDAMAALNGDEDYRVFNMAVNTFNDSKPSAFHNQIGGYSAAKLSRYQDMINFYLGRYGYYFVNNDLQTSLSQNQTGPNMNVSMPALNMLNARYLVIPFPQGTEVILNNNALGNCWFVKEVKAVQSPDEEILALNTIDPATTAVVDISKFKVSNTDFQFDENATIKLDLQSNTSSDYRRYVSNAKTNQLAVFSEIYYEPDWKVYVDEKPAEYIRVNYVLRAMVVPAGNHVIEFKNEAPTLHKTDTYGLIISIVTLLAMIGAVMMCYAPNKWKWGKCKEVKETKIEKAKK